jgi:hypothetical protein
MVDFETDRQDAPDAIIAVLRTLTHMDQTKGATPGTFKLKRRTHPNPRQIEGWQEFCLPSMFVEGLVLEVDIPGASDGLER